MSARRNGHISLFSRSALAKAWGRHGCRTGSFDDNMHVAFRTLPDFARRLAENLTSALLGRPIELVR